MTAAGVPDAQLTSPATPIAAVAAPSSKEMLTRTTWTVRKRVALPSVSRARGSFLTRRRNCGQTTRDQTPETTRTTARNAGSSTALVALEPGLGLLGLQVQGLADHRLCCIGDLAAEERHRGGHVALELDPGAATLGYETLDGVHVQRCAGDLERDLALPGAVGCRGLPAFELGDLQAFADKFPGEVRHPGGGDGAHGGGAEGGGGVAFEGERFQGAADELARVAQEVFV